MNASDRRFRSGDICVEPGWYQFDGYVDGDAGPYPSLGEVEVSLFRGEAFPVIRSAKRACYWTPSSVDAQVASRAVEAGRDGARRTPGYVPWAQVRCADGRTSVGVTDVTAQDRPDTALAADVIIGVFALIYCCLVGILLQAAFRFLGVGLF